MAKRKNSSSYCDFLIPHYCFFLKSDSAVVSKEFKKFFAIFSHQICFVFFASLIRFPCLRILVGFRRSSLVGPHRIPSVTKELKKFPFQFFRTRFVLFSFASLIRFLCFRILVGFRRSSLVGPHRIPSAMLFEKHLLILLSGRWTFGTTRTTTSLQSPCLFTCNMRSCKRCCCARFRRFDLLSTLFADSQR